MASLVVIDIIAILFIIILSCCLCMGNSEKNSRCLLSHIVVGLSVIVFYKLSRYYKLKDNLSKTENFYDGDPVSNSMNNFVTGSSLGLITPDQASTLTPTDLASYNTKLDTLIGNINSLQDKLNSPSADIVANPDNMTSMDLDSLQKYQMFQIDYLNKQVKNSQDILNAQQISNSTTNYKPIKVFSSCVISNANGSTTNNQQFDNVIQSLNPSNIAASSASAQQIMKTTSQQPALDLSASTGAIGSFLSNLSNFNSVNVNVV